MSRSEQKTASWPACGSVEPGSRCKCDTVAVEILRSKLGSSEKAKYKTVSTGLHRVKP